jgi:hypothetical protein
VFPQLLAALLDGVELDDVGEDAKVAAVVV